MAIVIEIKVYQGYYHSLDAVVKADDTLKIKTDISNATFTIVIDNKDGFIANAGKLISFELTQGDGEKTIGTVSSSGSSIKNYGIYIDSAGSIPGIDAPPRIIRVS